jgi:hypothetical protein
VIATTTDIRTLRGHCRGEVLTSQDHRWDEVRRVCSLSDDQQPAAIAFPRGDFDRAVLASFARAAGLQVAKCIKEVGDDLSRTLLLAESDQGSSRFARV